MKLTDSKIRSINTDKPVKLTDGNGLYIRITPVGKSFRYDYRYQGKRKTLTLGKYPHMTLKDARQALYKAKEVLAGGDDPSLAKRRAKHINPDESFEAVATLWNHQHDCTDRNRKINYQRLKNDAFPLIGAMHVSRIKPVDVVAVIRRIESRGTLDDGGNLITHIELASRVSTLVSQVMRHAVYLGMADSDPCRDLKGAVRRKRIIRSYPAIIEPVEFGHLLNAIDTYQLNVIIRQMLQLAPHVALRPSEMRMGWWDEIDLDNALWTIPESRMKKRRDHLVPLSTQALQILRDLEPMTRSTGMLFPSHIKPGQAMSNQTMSSALARLGYHGRHCPHGFRSTFSTLANTSGLFSPDVIEAQLAHLDPNRVRAAYNRSDWQDERTRLMQWWSDQVGLMRAGKPLDVAA